MVDFSFEPQERDCLAATVACARCKGLSVVMIAGEDGADEKLVCVDCKTLLEIDFGV